MNIVLIFITIISIILCVYCVTSKIQVDSKIISQNKELAKEKEELSKDVNILTTKSQSLKVTIEQEKEHLLTLQDTINSTSQGQKELSRKAFESYCEVLENKYKEVEQEYDKNIELLNESYSKIQLKSMREADKYLADLDKIRATRAAAIEAIRREKEIENNLSFYCLDIVEEDKADIAKLNALKPSLNKPRILSMLIWQTYFQKVLKALSVNILGTDTVTGVYKITNIQTKECYVGQAVDLASRWADHCKAGLGIDTPANNKLYKAMQEYSLWNFSFELLEECPREQLNEKEKYYIELYDSYNYGYNSNRGLNK